MLAPLLIALAVAASPPSSSKSKGKKSKPAAAKTAPAPAESAPVAPPSASSASAAPEKTDVQPAQKPKLGLQGMGRTPEEQKQLDELQDMLRAYEDESREFKHDVQLLVEKKYEEKRSDLAASYEKAIRDLEVNERKDRLDAIAQFEEFLQRYPDEPRYTPDVMFRLAELYYERSADDHAVAMRSYEDQLKRMDPASNAPPPPEPAVDFRPSIALYRQLLDKFPKFKFNDATTYLLGYCLEKQNDFEGAQQAYHDVIDDYPKSKFVTEAWVRIGEYYFDDYDDPDALPQAAVAYEHAIQDTKSPLYDKALYKLGWTYYRQDRFEPAVQRFLQLVDYYDKTGPKKDGKSTGDLRGEALQYTAISFADEKWGSVDKAKATFAKMGGRPYEAEVYRRMGDVYFDQTRHTEAIAAYRQALQRDPLAVDAPKIQQKIVQAYERDRKLNEAFAESEALANAYAPGTAWYEKHKNDPEVIAATQDMAERNLYGSAVYHHQQALALKQQGKLEAAKTLFDSAATGYEGYLARFPRSKSAYEVQFFAAECQYNSLQFAKAAKNYDAIRDTGADDKYRKDAAYGSVLAWTKLVEQMQDQKKLPRYAVLRSKDRPEGEKPQPIALAPEERSLIAATDAFVQLSPNDERAPGVSYKAAELLYAHNQFPDARQRFETIIRSYPKSEVSKYATNLTVETFLIDKDWRSVEEVSARLAQNTEVIDPKSELYKDLVKFKLAGRFKLADELMAQGAWDEAAKKYIQLVDEEPKHEFADKALNNAAVCYEKDHRFESALKLYERIFKEYPNSKLADAALFRVAVNQENSYDFDHAVQSYEQLVKQYPASKDREAALYNAARLLEGQQKYPQAAATYARYADLFPKAEDAPKNQYRAALVYEKQGDTKNEVKALNEFVRRFGSKPNQAELMVEAHKRLGDAYAKSGDPKTARRSWETAAKEFDRKGLKPDAALQGADAAAESRFQVAEQDLKEFDKLKIGGKGKALENSFTVKRNAVKKVQGSYAEVFKYKRIEWTLAALYRQGYVLERFGATINETPVPPDVKRLGDEAVAAYQDLLQQQTAALEDKAVESYAATLEQARKNRISNEWTKKTLEALNRYRPKDYPVLKDPKPAIAVDVTWPDGLVSAAVAKEKAQAVPAKEVVPAAPKPGAEAPAAPAPSAPATSAPAPAAPASTSPTASGGAR
ncbi:MAG TPA: tetratricopeptide repeat protein [Myxococcaceae bacterium]|nr:tetratricopeptide repeat protein [Myxococcaceae bacterium]